MSLDPPAGLPRVVEAVLAAAGLLALWPLLGLVALAVKLDSAGPILFRQQRVGRGGRPFELIKFRTMTHRPTGPGDAVTAAGDRRVTRVGAVLRATKLDELPQLIHVVRGEMSLVGPRPEVATFVEMDDPLWRAVLRARPGLTDPVTLRLRSEEALLAALRHATGLTTEEVYRRHLLPWKLRGYAEALRRRGPLSDLRVLAATLAAIGGGKRPPEVREILRDGNLDA